MKKRFIFLLLIGFWFHMVKAQVTITVTSVPSNTPATDTLFIAGNFNNWNPHEPRFMFTRNNGICTIGMPSVGSPIQFKITRGSWGKVECDSTGADIDNHTFNNSIDSKLFVKVAGWKDLLGGNIVKHTAANNVLVISDSFYMPQLNAYRRIWIYLPPNYYKTDLRYPVFYMHDGQNLFDAATSFSGEWKVDESLNSLFASGDKGCIVVGIDNGGKERLNEYSPWVNPKYGGGKGDKYMDFIVTTLKPFIDSIYRTVPDRKHTGLCGSSMGGLISFYGAIKYQQVFGMAGVFSPSFWFSDSLYAFVSKTGKKADVNFYFVAGQHESEDNVVADIDKMNALLISLGFNASGLKEVIVPDGKHNESFWSREFPAAYQWLMKDR